MLLFEAIALPPLWDLEEVSFLWVGVTWSLAQANCTLFCAPNAQKKTGSQQGKKTIFLDV